MCRSDGEGKVGGRGGEGEAVEGLDPMSMILTS